MDIRKESERIFDEVVAWRRHFHMYPEPAMKEYKTSKKVKEILKNLDIPYQSIGDTGVVGFIGRGYTRTVALRADMDALMIQENNQVPYKSKNEGCMHACGHDGHTASLLGAAAVLKKFENELNVNLKLIFQPAEENCLGARLMVDHHVLDDVDEIYGIHIFADVPAGKISIEAGPRMASTDMFKAIITGSAGHAAKPHQCVDAIIAAAASVMNLQTIMSREMNPIESGVVTVGKLYSGTQYNIISGEALIEGTVRTFSMKNANYIKKSIERIVSMTAETFRAKASFEFSESKHPVVFNDEKLVKNMAAKAETLFGEAAMYHVPPMMLGEDFSIYQTKVPGIFAFVGAGNPEKDCIYPNHHDCFNIDEQSLLDCVMLYVMFALNA